MRKDVMRNMLERNLGLISVRQVAEGVFNHCFISETIIESRVTISNKGIGYLFPLYIYKDKTKLDLFSQQDENKTPNLSNQVAKKLPEIYNLQLEPEEIMFYIYSILFSDIYRIKYSDFLTYDFPRIPFTSDIDSFINLVELGKRLTGLHLLKSPELDQPVVKFKGKGDDITIGTRRYDEATERVFINEDYYFEGVAPKVWEYQIAGYQVLDKYLKDRKGRRMDDPRHYIHIATALEKTIEIQAEIDAIYPEVEKDVIEF
jgi:predicted helicase